MGFSWVQLALKFTLRSLFSVPPFVFIVLRGTTSICNTTHSGEEDDSSDVRNLREDLPLLNVASQMPPAPPLP